MIWSPLQLTSKQWIITQQFTATADLFKYKKDLIKKQPRKGGDIIFPILSQWGISVAMETRVLS